MNTINAAIIAVVKIEYLLKTLPDPETYSIGYKLVSQLFFIQVWKDTQDLHSTLREIYKEDKSKLEMFDSLDELITQQHNLENDILEKFKEIKIQKDEDSNK
jgi:hypothetical protein